VVGASLSAELRASAAHRLWNHRRVRCESVNVRAAPPPYAPAVAGALELLTCCQQFFPPELKAGVKVLYDVRSGPNNSLVPPSKSAETGVGVSRDFLSVRTSSPTVRRKLFGVTSK